MAGDDDDLRLNTLHRFAKRSPRLVLHEYSHCEVPAGCGGVVLRWIDPARGLPATIRLFGGEVQGSCWLDGEALETGLALVRAGPCLLAAHVRRGERGAQPFTITVRYDEDDEDEPDLIARGAARLRATARRPGDGWAAPAFDDAAWGEPARATAKQIAAQSDWVRRNLEEAAGRGKAVLAIDTDELWLRIAFTAPAAAAEAEAP